jgi:hypothetical protein
MPAAVVKWSVGGNAKSKEDKNIVHESTTSAQVPRGPGNDILLLDPQSGAMLGSLKAHKETVYAITVLEEPELVIVTSSLRLRHLRQGQPRTESLAVGHRMAKPMLPLLGLVLKPECLHLARLQQAD